MAPAADDAPLRGLRVVEFGQFIAAPACAQALADLGADVIKVESPAGDAARAVGWTRDAYGPMFTAYNRGKRSVALDLRQPLAREQAQRLAVGADVVLQNARPGAMDRQGLGAARLLALAPRLVYGQVSGFGQSGPASVRAGFDIAAQAESGMMSLNGEAGRDPVRVGFTVVDALAAQMLTTGVLAALVRRGIGGRGGLVDVSLIDVAIAALSNAWAEYGLTGAEPTRRGNGQPMAAPAADVVATLDGMVVVSAYTEDHFPKLCAAIGRPALAEDPRFARNQARVQNRQALLATLHEALGGMRSDQVCDALAAAGVVAGAVRSMGEVRPGQAGVSADLFVDVAAAGRPAVRVPGLPLAMDGVQRGAGRLPAIGEHTDEVLAELLG
ncbi:CaiB/BaiF CoA transferase family protein [Pseudorhodoferax sp.]|uniref:CaiB/BaiF CoA transferase family protein n=1 Tax=Pseudorhodoferax sp. TaxID=1993553 RepID=UPI002DD641D5|nr:CoA transferase [Pseudorhodoferax sp.]